jgi:hypothetical protein
MGPLDVNMAFRPYSSCPLLSRIALCTSTRALDLFLVLKHHGMSVYRVLYQPMPLVFYLIHCAVLSIC